jgi:hypothetical protein
MKEEEKSRFDIVVSSWKRLDDIERLETAELEEKRLDLKKTLETLLLKIQTGKYDDTVIAFFNDAVTNLVAENAEASRQRLEPMARFRPDVTKMTSAPEAPKKRDIPLLRVHNTIIHEGRVDRPVITYYRVNGEAGRLEEAFRIAGNQRSFLGVGDSYES